MGSAYDRGLLLYRQKRYALAAEEFRRELSAVPNSANAHAMLGLSMLYQNKRYGDVAFELNTAMELGPDVAFVHYAMAHLKLRQPMPPRRFKFQNQQSHVTWRKARAREHAEQAIRLDVTNAGYFCLLAGLELELCCWDAALSAAERGLAVSPTHQGCAAVRANALLALGRSDEADQTIDAALRADAESPLAHRQRGWMMLRLGRPRDAAEHFRQALRLEPTDKATIRALRQARRARFWPYGFVLRWFLIASAGRPKALLKTILMLTAPVMYYGIEPLANRREVLLAMVVGTCGLATLGFRSFCDFGAIFDPHDRTKRSWQRKFLALVLVLWWLAVFSVDQNYSLQVKQSGSSLGMICAVALIPPLPAIVMLVIRRSARRTMTSRPAELST